MKTSVKWVGLFLALILLMEMFPLRLVEAAEGTEPADSTRPATVDEALKRINQDMQEFYGLQNYYPNSVTINNETRTLRRDLIQKHLNPPSEQTEREKLKNNTFQIVYGGDHGRTLNHKGKEMKEYSGYTKNGHSVPTEGVPWYQGWSGRKIQNFNLIPDPWLNQEVRDKYGIAKSDFDEYKNTKIKYLIGGTFEQLIIQGLNTEYAGVPYSEFMYNNQNSDYGDQSVYTKNAKPKSGNWIDYVHVLQPPTMFSWGFGTVYIDSNVGVTYLDIPIAPFALLESDLAATFDKLPEEAVAGEQVQAAVRVNSTFTDPVTTNYSWTLTKKDGTRLTAQADNLAFSGHANAESGSFSVSNAKSAVLYATFTMPDSDVRIQFKVNEDGKAPKEKNLDNNALDSNPLAVKLVKPEPLPYDVLSTKVKFPLRDGNPITAILTLPEGKWVSNATGQLNVNNNAPDLFRDFKVEGNPRVNEAREVIERYPVVNAIIKREDFGDDPLNRKWKNPENPKVPIRKSGTVSYGGSVKRDYEYQKLVCSKGGGCSWVTVRETAHADFNSGENRKIYDVYVYNGTKELGKHTYENKIENNTPDSKTKKLFWENEPYTYDVIRWMKHIDENGQPYNWTAVPGQYERTFTQQASADIAWKSESPMAEQYQKARQAAKDKTNKKSLYDKAVFATDRQLQKYAYPVKSGYYFNPAGSYTFTVKTVMYKQSPDDTKDHKDMVDTLIDSFRYETNLIYINSKKKAVNIANEPLAAKGGGFKAAAGQLTAGQPKGVDGKTLLNVLDREDDESRYKKDVEEIFYSQDQDESKTHEYWKRVLEGYSESSTQGSKENYQYREYVADKQKKMYKITETTTVTIEINPDNIPVYTHANMQNGKYYVKAWINDAPLSRGGHTYKKLGTLQGIDVLDNIEVTVVGSMFDDLND
ncbi:hypothetical protein EHV15_11270 [Paenibacillus oralis]|uniref:Uncharacterized protein n=1 Tax=Paenibacillus oralis TaxID=2490856 RepID=A0A3P3U1E4_9BACL|nr:hypothetical protein [Paenibacillus oralis]RRJ63439.1 hypothetical protein EHV15_11270 [Paenibacillus oralis]